MQIDIRRPRWRRSGAGVVWLLAALLGGARVATAQAPVAPAVSAGTYTVTYTVCGDCIADWLEERPEGGSWRQVGSGGTVSVTGKASGTYYYRAGYHYFVDPYYFSSAVSYSAETRVTVSANAPPLDSLENQLKYRYETRYGDGNGDGRRDLFVNRIAGGVTGNGTLEATLLVQDGHGRFTSLVPSAAQAAAWRSWPSAAIQVVLGDFNVDGFVDVLLKGVAGAIGLSGAANQIAYAPGRPLAQAPLGVRAVDAALKRFAGNARDYLADSSYFTRNAPVTTFYETAYYYYCAPGYSDYYYGGSCSWFPYYVAFTAPDYSVFETNALNAWTQENAIQQNRVTQAQGVESIKRSFESALGVPIGGRDLGGVLAEQGTLDTTHRRGFELFLAVLGISDANAQDLTPPREVGRRPDVVYVTGRRILGFLPIHTALEYGGSTISAYDSNSSFLNDGTLVSQVNWASDRPALMMTLGTVGSALGSAAYWTQLRGADGRYDDNLVYDAIPSASTPGFNSNGYVHGVVRATAGTPSINLNDFVGGAKPVPPQAFN